MTNESDLWPCCDHPAEDHEMTVKYGPEPTHETYVCQREFCDCRLDH